MLSAFLSRLSHAAGRPITFVAAAAMMMAANVLWRLTGASGDMLNLINLAISEVSLLLLFGLQHTQNRDGHALHLKIDELVRAVTDARDDLIGIEEKTEEEVALLARPTS